MAQNFIACDREQELLLPPSLRDWLPADHLAWFMLDAVAEVDMAAFYASYRTDGWGRAAHDPAMMLALLLYAYAIGERSSRRMERRCREDVAFRVITANHAPDHATIARFRVRHERALGDLFGEVLALCAKGGLVSVGVIAVDSTKVHANASQHANRDFEQIARDILDDADAVDGSEDEQLGERRVGAGDCVGAGQARLAARSQAPPGCRARRPGQADPALTHRTAERMPAPAERGPRCRVGGERGLRGLSGARGVKDGRRFGRPPNPYTPPATPPGKVNRTDPDSRNVKTPRGYMQGYNAQAVTTERQIVIAAEVNADSPDFGHLEPMICAAERELQGAGVDEAPGVVVADSGYWHQDQMERIVSRGIPVLIPPDAGKRTGTRPGWDGGIYAFMRSVLASEPGGAIYAQRKAMIEPVFADTKFNRRIDRFQRRGRAACRSEWRLITATHNLLKLWRHTTAPQPA